MDFTADDYYAWRKHPVTEQFMGSVVEEINNRVADLVTSAGENQLSDRGRRGEIVGLQWLFDWVPTVEAPEVNLETEVDEDGTSSTGPSGTY